MVYSAYVFLCRLCWGGRGTALHEAFLGAWPTMEEVICWLLAKKGVFSPHPTPTYIYEFSKWCPKMGSGTRCLHKTSSLSLCLASLLTSSLPKIMWVGTLVYSPKFMRLRFLLHSIEPSK